MMNAYCFAPNIYVDDPNLRVTGYNSEESDEIARFGIHNATQYGHNYAIRWRYITASNNPQIWIVQDPATSEIIGIWQADDPPEIEITDNPFKIVPIQYYDREGKPYGITSYVEIPEFLDEFKATLRAGIKEIRKRYRLLEMFKRPDKLPLDIRFYKLERV